MSALPSEPADFARSIATAVTRRADVYAEAVEAARIEGELRERETELLDQFERYTADVLDRSLPPGPRNRESLLFARIYDTRDASAGQERRGELLTKLMAAEVESRGPLRLTQAQNERLATIFERLGSLLLGHDLLLHAALAFDRAAGLFRLLGDEPARDRCLYARTRARQKAASRGWGKTVSAISWALCGYGYKPYWLLGWVLFQLVFFSAALLVTAHASFWPSLYMSLTNYLNPLGVGDTEQLGSVGRIILVAESYGGSISLSVFFALLVRRWFRT
jgi:hypothetical protein